jgi:hypothetical protein
MSEKNKAQDALDAAIEVITDHGFSRSFAYINDGQQYHFTRKCTDMDIVDLICALQNTFPNHFDKAMMHQLTKAVSMLEGKNQTKH